MAATNLVRQPGLQLFTLALIHVTLLPSVPASGGLAHSFLRLSHPCVFFARVGIPILNRAGTGARPWRLPLSSTFNTTGFFSFSRTGPASSYADERSLLHFHGSGGPGPRSQSIADSCFLPAPSELGVAHVSRFSRPHVSHSAGCTTHRPDKYTRLVAQLFP